MGLIQEAFTTNWVSTVGPNLTAGVSGQKSEVSGQREEVSGQKAE